MGFVIQVWTTHTYPLVGILTPESWASINQQSSIKSIQVFKNNKPVCEFFPSACVYPKQWVWYYASSFGLNIKYKNNLPNWKKMSGIIAAYQRMLAVEKIKKAFGLGS